ncbi:Striatin-interacting protein 1 homolog,Striatin-interacting protein 2,Striatin-interacting proteins 2,Striatin-interacting protein 1 [Lepeophtheirus salmonis]|uniref:Striatin-interacting protein 1 homolog,Striatin-interacting protein 2,Striatin-interacting proteins 2,Striatin-interacting protein 1 n=1 Tax=Lepeophtheirus salmonis TaxID=72036 RepID=A0A7R8CI33_LEPSM|nr:Striatin-interacting protein 1 homolog,Striatin-interacting protein 2,Striatin-interacting proteins 2,Striatin-interacting protein 1 [Lepeophtheirus salmonis]CAF2829051.1 Striatin-interacting protein 1 homolog,Striatin-interacting protein 2,Striatin-interacting proteins 2,Striatin-interacting protein 1 [Lepeophtheirus salmonis]
MEREEGNSSGIPTGPPRLSKIKEVVQRQRKDSEDEGSPDIDFEYNDDDSLPNEISELYSYTEYPEYNLNQQSFNELLLYFRFKDKSWGHLNMDEKRRYIMNLANMIDVSKPDERMKAIRAFLYLCQGCWLECQSDAECFQSIEENVVLLYDCGIFTAFVELLDMEIENQVTASHACRKLAVNINDSIELRVILSVIYTMVHVLRVHPDEFFRKEFQDELNTPIKGELLAIRLFSMITKFCSGTSPHFPMKKVLLLLWKVLLTSLGGFETLKKLKDEIREKNNLEAVIEDTVTISKQMRPASPPAACTEFGDPGNNFRKAGLSSYSQGARRLKAPKQHHIDLGMNPDDDDDDVEFDNSLQGSDNDKRSVFSNDISGSEVVDDNIDRIASTSPETSIINPGIRALPWTPKVRMGDLDQFLDYSRLKFVGYSLREDRTTLAGLPDPIHEAVKVLKKHMYISLSEKQIESENNILNRPILNKDVVPELTATEILYKAMLPSLPQNMISLLKILLAAAPTSKAKTDSINIMTDVIPDEIPITSIQSMKLGIDVHRHKEIIVKAVSAILLLLLKHFKVNHIYQFEFMSQHLVFANCIPLVLKFFNQKMSSYISSKNNIALLDFPSCVIGEQPVLTAETVEVGDTSVYCWRIMFSCINLLRVLNKLTKWKQSRIMMLVVFKSTPILQKTLKVRHAMFQLYALKLLKMQTKYLGRQWRKSHMKILTSIYTQVRHRLNDDWAYGNDVDSHPLDFQAEESELRTAVDRFHCRRYECLNSSHDGDFKNMTKDFFADDFHFESVDNCISSVLSQEIELMPEFKQNYEKWLNREVFKNRNKVGITS